MRLILDSKPFVLPLKHPFTISRYTVKVQKTVVASVSNGEVTGYGEATANPYYGSTVEKLQADIASVNDIVACADGLHPAELWKLLEPKLRHNYFALCAIDVAYWDFYARRQNKPLRALFPTTGRSVATSYTIGIDTLDNMRRKLLEMPWPIYKIKLGTPDDVKIVESLRNITDSLFRVDANAAWTTGEAVEKSRILKELNVEFIEQPLRADDLAGMKRLKHESHLPLIADESCQKFEDVDLCAEIFHGINIKLMKCGGITPALRMINRARELGLKVMAGCMTESTIGISALAQLAPQLDYFDADGALLLSEDIATGVSFFNGCPIYLNTAGTGAEMLAF